MTHADIPADVWRIISAGVRDKDELHRLRFAFWMGFNEALSKSVDAIHAIKTPSHRWPDECLIEACKSKQRNAENAA